MKDKFIIRECLVKDLDSVVSLQHQWVKEDITHGLIPVERECLEVKLGKYFFIAEINSEIVGFAYGAINRADNMAVMNNGELYIEVEDIYVSQDYRGTGLGGILLDKLLDTAKDNGIHRSMIYSSTKDMEGIISFYKKHDYKTWYIQMYK